jgi:DNA-binding Xre family transcriptional regulator
MSNGKSVLLSNKKGVTPKKLNLIKYGKGLTIELTPTDDRIC